MNLLLVIADRRYAISGHICRISTEAPDIDVLIGDHSASDWKRCRALSPYIVVASVEGGLGAPVSAAVATQRTNW